ncbi:MFS transporter [Nocardia sp. NPDC058499]|uniref:MFS transporter n=1 Tax=Nocardia sp. NPDC058499 TaxID=3346530 RepID=UPI0036522ECB
MIKIQVGVGSFSARGFMSDRSLSLRLSVLAGALFVVSTNSLNIAGLLPNIAESLDVSIGSVSYGITVYAVVAAVASPMIAAVFSHRSRTSVLVSGMVLVAAGTLATALAPNLSWFIAGRAFAALGGAAVVPVVTAVAPQIVEPSWRGRALATVGLGFTAATALGAPLATALAAVTNWRFSIGTVAGLAALAAFAMSRLTRGLPSGSAPAGRALRTVLSNPFVLIALLGNTLITLATEVVYIFSAEVSGRTGTSLAILLFFFGVAAIGGNHLGGWLTDRWGTGRAGLVGAAVLASVLLYLTLAGNNYLLAAVGFAVFGVTSYMVVVPRQYQLIAIAPGVATVSLSCFTTAMYIGLAFGPVIGAQLVPHGGSAVAFGGALIACLAFALFLMGLLLQRRVRHVTPYPETSADTGNQIAKTPR